MTVLELLAKHNWNVFFCHFPSFHDGKPYRIYKSHQSNQNELLGCGTTPEEAISSASQTKEDQR